MRSPSRGAAGLPAAVAARGINWEDYRVGNCSQGRAASECPAVGFLVCTQLLLRVGNAGGGVGGAHGLVQGFPTPVRHREQGKRERPGHASGGKSHGRPVPAAGRSRSGAGSGPAARSSASPGSAAGGRAWTEGLREVGTGANPSPVPTHPRCPRQRRWHLLVPAVPGPARGWAPSRALLFSSLGICPTFFIFFF